MEKLDHIESIINRDNFVSSVVHSVANGNSVIHEERRGNCEFLAAGAPAVYLSHGKVFKNRKDADELKRKSAERKKEQAKLRDLRSQASKTSGMARIYGR